MSKLNPDAVSTCSDRCTFKHKIKLTLIKINVCFHSEVNSFIHHSENERNF